jgi:hypothetical protein
MPELSTTDHTSHQTISNYIQYFIYFHHIDRYIVPVLNRTQTEGDAVHWGI